MNDRLFFLQAARRQLSRRGLLKGLGGTLLGAALWQQLLPSRALHGQNATNTPELTWDALQNATYPSPWTANKRVTLKNGEFRSKALANGGGEIQIFLSEMRVFGDLNGDGVDDAVVLLTTNAGGVYFFDLIPILNQQGQPKVQTATFLGDRTIIKNLSIENGRVILQAAELQPDGGDSPPDHLRTYLLRGKQLALQSKKQMAISALQSPAPESAALPSQLVELTQANNRTTLQGTLAGQTIQEYIVPADRGKMLVAQMSSQRPDLALSVYGRSEGQVLLSITEEKREFQAETPSKQDYVIQVVNLSNLSSEYTLTIRLMDLVR